MSEFSTLDVNALRSDGRRPSELRRIRVRMGVFGQADGSAYVEQGKTKVLVAVYGPHQPRNTTARSSSKSADSIVNCLYSSAVFSSSAGERKRRPHGDRKSQEKSFQLRRAMEAIIHLDLYLKSQIDIFVQLLQTDGSAYCTAVNAATLALIDAGIAIKDYAIGCTVTSTESSDKDKDSEYAGLLDVNSMEENQPGVTLSVVSMPGIETNSSAGCGSLILAHGAGRRLHLSKIESLKVNALCGCKDIKEILDQAVRNHLTMHSAASYSAVH